MPVNQPPKGRGAGAQYEIPAKQPTTPNGTPTSPGPGFSEPVPSKIGK